MFRVLLFYITLAITMFCWEKNRQQKDICSVRRGGLHCAGVC